jgi:putative ABC transport system permease protein
MTTPMTGTMLAHLAKLIWNRRRANALILTELCAAFLVLAALTTSAAYYRHNAQLPLGYSMDDVWSVGVGHGISRREGVPPEVIAAAMATSKNLILAVRDLPQVIGTAAAVTGPGVPGISNTQKSDGDNIPVLGRGLRYHIDYVTDSFRQLFGLELLRGRWFGREDDGGKYHPAVINERMAQEFFGPEDPIGRQIGSGEHDLPVRVVGVVAAYRQKGDLAPPVRYMFRRYIPGAADELPYHRLFVKTRPGTGADFEKILDQRLRATAGPEWSFGVNRLAEQRAVARRLELMPLQAAAIVGAFLILMVVLGLTGVLWQNVTQRTREIGLRRAKGATRQHIYGQILGELMIMTAIAVGLGLVLIAHVPLLALIDDLEPGIYAQGAAVAALVIFAVTAVCGYYPARLASRVQPALALRDE